MNERTRIQRKREKATAIPPIQKDALLGSPAVPVQAVDEIPPVVQDVLSSSGQPLDGDTREFMEPRFGHDFSKIRIHADGEAATAARNINAAAYTQGQDIVFGGGEYAPETDTGRYLLAHELAHVVQQSRGGHQTPPPMPAHPLEQAAQQAASMVTSGRAVEVEGASSPGIARQPRSLNESLDPTSMSDEDLAREIVLIRQWLSENQASSPERDQLTNVLSRMETEVAQRNGQQSQASIYQEQQPDSADTVSSPVLAAGMLSPVTPLSPTMPPPGTIPDGAWNQWPRIPGETDFQFPTTQVPDVTEAAVPETLETAGTAAAETTEAAAAVAETTETAAVLGTTVAETAETAAVVGGAVEGGGMLAAIGGALAAIPVAGWIALGVGAAALGGYLLYEHYHSDDGQVSASPANMPAQLPGQEGQNPMPVVDPTTGEPLYTPSDQDSTPVVDPTTGEILYSPPVDPAAGLSYETAGRKQDIRQVDDVARETGMSEEERNAFGNFLEDEKEAGNGGTKNDRGDFTYQELLEKAREFLNQYRGE